MRSAIFPILTFVLLFAAVSAAVAETRYISDQLVITVRSSNTDKYEVLTTLLTASPVEILEEDKTFVKVRTAKGIEGYIRKQYISKALPKAIRIARLQEQNAKLEAQLAKQQQDFQETSDLAVNRQVQAESLTGDLNKTRKELEKVSADYAELKVRSASVLDLTAERDQLLTDNGQMLSQLTVLQEENSSFHRSNMIQWFLAGGGVFFGGWLIGKISRKKRGYDRF